MGELFWAWFSKVSTISITLAWDKFEELESNIDANLSGMMAGIDVGHQFFSRAEMVVVGFFSHWLNGIDYIGQNGSKVYVLEGLQLPLLLSLGLFVHLYFV